MAKKRSRDIGAEILEGIREIKRGEFGRVVTPARCGVDEGYEIAYRHRHNQTIERLSQWSSTVHGARGGNMRRCPQVLLLLIALSVPCYGDVILKQESISAGQSPFGSIKNYSIITQKFRDEKTRIDLEVKGVVGNPLNSTTIIDRKAGTIYRIWHSRKVYDVVTPGELQKQQEQAADMLKKQGKIPTSRPVLKPTGRKETVNGYSAEEYVATIDSDTLTYWFAKSLSKFVAVLAKGGDPGGGVYMLRFPDPASFPGVPVRMVLDQNQAGNRIVTTINLLSIEERPVDDIDFALPKGYKEVKNFGELSRRGKP